MAAAAGMAGWARFARGGHRQLEAGGRWVLPRLLDNADAVERGDPDIDGDELMEGVMVRAAGVVAAVLASGAGGLLLGAHLTTDTPAAASPPLCCCVG